MTMNEVAIVILNWNGRAHLERYLPSVVAHSNGARIIVADNCSSDDSLSFLRSNYPTLEIIELHENHGFAEGYNEALKQVEAKFYLLLNSDVEVTEGWLDPLLMELRDETIAGCQPKILDDKNHSLFEHAGASGGFIDKNLYPFCRGRIFHAVEEDQSQYNGKTKVFWTSGACMLIRSKVFHSVGGFDGDFFAHMEEIDLCWRIKMMGHSFTVVPDSTVYHLGGGTLAYTSPRKVYLNFRNNLVMIAKNYDGWVFGKLFYRMALDGLAGAQFMLKGKFKNVIAILRAHFYLYGNCRSIRKKRKKVQSQSTQFDRSGFYKGSILWAFYFKKIKKFSDLNQRFLP